MGSKQFLKTVGMKISSVSAGQTGGKKSRFLSHFFYLVNKELWAYSGWVPHLHPWRRAWQLTPVFLPRKSSGTEELAGLQSIG